MLTRGLCEPLRTSSSELVKDAASRRGLRGSAARTKFTGKLLERQLLLAGLRQELVYNERDLTRIVEFQRQPCPVATVQDRVQPVEAVNEPTRFLKDNPTRASEAVSALFVPQPAPTRPEASRLTRLR
ncbi:hypothetical protein ABZU92_18380 [Micromonospora arida]|uniref:hypothetical protein n=1 Tax=Micromonospora arida TaxID=2203715 RepID=UPI0033B1432C